MKIAIAGKGGVGKTTITAWLGDYLACRGQKVWLVDADTALSLGQACGMERALLPEALVRQKALLEERIRPACGTMLNLTPRVDDLPQSLSKKLSVCGHIQPSCSAGEKRLLIMGPLTGAGEGCACESNALLKALLAHLILERQEWVLVDLEAGVEHLGRGTVAHVDALFIVSEPSMRSLETAAELGTMAVSLGLHRQALLLNRAAKDALAILPDIQGLPKTRVVLPPIDGLQKQQLFQASVFGLGDEAERQIELFFNQLFEQLEAIPVSALLPHKAF